jgi:hypothetical protein
VLFLGVLTLPFLVAVGVIAACVRVRGSLAPAERPSPAWMLALVVVVLLDAFLVLAFAFAVVVFNCHGGYECPF